jgi:hypothetical protein
MTALAEDARSFPISLLCQPTSQRGENAPARESIVPRGRVRESRATCAAEEDSQRLTEHPSPSPGAVAWGLSCRGALRRRVRAGVGKPKPSSPLERGDVKEGSDAAARGARGGYEGVMRARPGCRGGEGPYQAAAAAGRCAAPTPAWPPERAVARPPAQPVMRSQRRAPGCRWLAEGCASLTTDSLGLVQSRGGGTSLQRPRPLAARRAELAQCCSRSHVPAVVPSLRSWHRDCGRGDWVRFGWGSCLDSVVESPDLCFKLLRVRRVVTHRPPSSCAGIFDVP